MSHLESATLVPYEKDRKETECCGSRVRMIWKRLLSGHVFGFSGAGHCPAPPTARLHDELACDCPNLSPFPTILSAAS